MADPLSENKGYRSAQETIGELMSGAEQTFDFLSLAELTSTGLSYFTRECSGGIISVLLLLSANFGPVEREFVQHRIYKPKNAP